MRPPMQPPPPPSAAHQETRSPLRWSETLTLEYMQDNHPFPQLPRQYFASARRAADPPSFLYGFALGYKKDLVSTVGQLDALRNAIPTKRLRHPDEDLAVGAIVHYLEDAVTSDKPFPRAFGFEFVAPVPDVYRVFYFYTSELPDTPVKPRWVDELGKVILSVLQEMGWTGTTTPMWYLSADTLALPDNTDFNLPGSIV